MHDRSPLFASADSQVSGVSKAVMSLASAFVRFLPTDDSYAPFGLRWLRGLNTLPLSLAGLVGLSWTAEGSALALLEPTAFPWQYWAGGFVDGFYLSALLFMPMFAGIVAAINLSAGHSTWSSVAWLAMAVLVGAALIGLVPPPADCLLADPGDVQGLRCSTFDEPWGHVSSFIQAALWGAVIATVLYTHRRQRDAAHAVHDLQLRRMQAERQEAETRLLSLQAQIEPHFLFNTLAHIERLHQVDARLGASMLGSLIEYMRSALPQMRETESSLGRELALVNAYVHVQQIRMGERLRVEVDVPDELLGACVPPMMVLTLAENAVKHGLGPQRRGGTLHIGARRLPDMRLEIEVRDDGVGLRPGSGTGRGLSNVRARLATLFGADGTLEIGNRGEGGASAALQFPLVVAALPEPPA